MKTFITLLALALSLAAVADDDVAPDFGGEAVPPFEAQQALVNKFGVAGKPAAARALAPAVAPEKAGDGHYTYCQVRSGMGHELTLSKDAAFTNRKVRFQVHHSFQDDYDHVEDARVEIKKNALFETKTHKVGGFITQTMRTSTYTVRAVISSKSTEIGQIIAGCIPQAVKSVELTFLCTDSEPIKEKPERGE